MMMPLLSDDKTELMDHRTNLLDKCLYRQKKVKKSSELKVCFENMRQTDRAVKQICDQTCETWKVK